MTDILHVAARVPCTTAEGPFERYALWVRGCSLRCVGCCNPELFAPGSGPGTPVTELLADLDRARRDDAIEGVTVLGGEPLDQLEGVTAFCRGAAERGLGVIVFTGHRRADLAVRPGFAALWRTLDTLVDGPFDVHDREPVDGRRFVGSRNQTLHHRTPRYAAPALWRGPARIEVHVDPDGRVHAHGFPLPLAALLRALPPHERPEGPRDDAVLADEERA